MKKLIYLLILGTFMVTSVSAQQVVTKNETKTKKTSTLPQKVHNIFSKKKKYSGTKTKHVVKKHRVE